MTNPCEKLCEFIRENPVKNFVKNKPVNNFMCKTVGFSPSFNSFSHPLFNNFIPLDHPKIFTHFHKTYYYNYDILKINNYNRKV